MFASALSAQHHEWSIAGGIGGSALNFDTRHIGVGGNIGLGYARFFSDEIGLRMGLDLSVIHTEKRDALYTMTETSALSNQWINMPQNYRFLYTATARGLDATTTAVFLNVPIMFVYKPFLRNFHIATGLKFGVPMFGNYNATFHQLTTTGYSEFTRQTYANHPLEGFSTFNDLQNETNLDLNPVVKFSFEIGWAWLISRRSEFYLSFYVDQMLNNISNNSGGFRVEHNGGNLPIINNPPTLRATTVGVRLRVARFFVTPSNNRHFRF